MSIQVSQGHLKIEFIPKLANDLFENFLFCNTIYPATKKDGAV